MKYSPHTAVRDTNAQPPVNLTADEYAPTTFREAVGLFPDMDSMQDAIRELEGSAFQRDAISVLGSRHEIEKIFGTTAIDTVMAEDDPRAPRQAPSRPEEQNIGAGALIGGIAYVGAVSAAIIAMPATIPLTLAAVALGGGSGAAIGAGIVSLLGNRLDHHAAEQLQHGGLLLWVRTPDAEREMIAVDIMRKHGAHHIKVHDMPNAQQETEMQPSPNDQNPDTELKDKSKIKKKENKVDEGLIETFPASDPPATHQITGK